MQTTQSLLQGVANYHQKQYAQALKIFTDPMQPVDQLSELTMATLAAITKLQMCHYNQAAQELNQIRLRLLEVAHSVKQQGQIALLKVKVLSNLLVIMMVNCHEQMDDIFQELMEVVKEKIQQSSKIGQTLFQIIIKSLFGYSSFQQIQSESQTVIKSLNNLKGQQKSKDSKLNPAYLSSLSVYCHLIGNFEGAIQLQEYCSILTKKDHPVLHLISLKHLQQLSRIVLNNKEAKRYRQQLALLINTQMFQGVAEQTLFRNYKKKMQGASRLVVALMQKQKQWRTQIDSQLQSIAVIYKLKKSKKTQNNAQVSMIIQLIKQDKSALQLMSQSDFVVDACKQYARNVNTIVQVLSFVFKRKGFMKLVLSSQGVKKRQVQYSKRQIDIDLNQFTQGSIAQKQIQKHYTPSRKSKDFQPSPNRYQKINLIEDQVERKVPNPASRYQKFQRTEEQFQREVPNPPPSAQSRYMSNQANNKNRVYLEGGQSNVYFPGQPQIFKKVAKQQRSKVEQSIKRDVYQINVNKVDREQAEKGQKFNISKTFKQEKKRISSKVQKASPLRPQASFAYKQNSSSLSQFIKNKEQAFDSVSPIDMIQKIVEPPSQPELQPIKKQAKIQEFPKAQQLPSSTSVLQSKPPLYPPPSPRKAKLAMQSQAQSINIVPTYSQPTMPYTKLLNKGYSQTSKSQSRSQREGTPSQKLNARLRRFISLCQSGQYIEKRHSTSDGGCQRFLKLSKNRERLFWGETQEALNLTKTDNSCLMQDIKGIVFGQVTNTLTKQCNSKLEPWKCFSIVLKDRTRDFHCIEQGDVKFWVIGLSLCLSELNLKGSRVLYSSRAIQKRIQIKNKEVQPHNTVLFDNKPAPRLYSLGRFLWRRFLMRLKWEHLKARGDKKHKSKRSCGCANAYAIVVAAVRYQDYKLQHMRRLKY